MTGPSGSQPGSPKRDQELEAEREGAGAESTDAGRRDMLNLIKKAAIAGPVLLTLKSAPARAASTTSGTTS